MSKHSLASLGWGIEIKQGHLTKLMEALENADSFDATDDVDKDSDNEDDEDEDEEEVDPDELFGLVQAVIDELPDPSGSEAGGFATMFDVETHVSEKRDGREDIRCTIQWAQERMYDYSDFEDEGGSIPRLQLDIWGHDSYGSKVQVLENLEKTTVYRDTKEMEQAWAVLKKMLCLEKAGVKYREGWILGLRVG